MFDISKNMLGIIAIQEHRLQTKSDIDTILQPEFTFYYFSANNNRNGGIGILVGKHLISTILMFQNHLNVVSLLPSNVT